MTKAPLKKTIYVDVDEEITGIIDKLRTANEQIVALVLPKRATMLQSVVNMKLLKRAADQEDKKAVLITSESSLMPLAGAAGLHVAHNLQSRPFLPPVPDTSNAGVLAANPSDEDIMIDPTTPIGEVAGLPDDNAIEIDNRPKETAAAAGAGAAAAKAAKKKPKFKIPDFNKFRTKLVIAGALLILLLIGWWWAFMVAPTAKVTIKGDTNDIPLSVGFTADTEADNLDAEQGIVPSRQLELKKTVSEKVPATGQKDKGAKASGTISVSLPCSSSVPASIPAGTGVSAASLTFITQKNIVFSPTIVGGACQFVGDSKVVAQQNGEQYNLAARSDYKVSGRPELSAEDSEGMKGGSTGIVKVISQADVDGAKQKLAEQQAKGREELKKQLEDDDYWAIIETFAEKDPKYTSSPAVDAEANEVTVTLDVTYSMLGVRKDDLKKLLEHNANKQVDSSKQAILSDGLDKAAFTIGKKTEKTTEITMATTVVAGPEVDKDAIKRDIAGKKRGEAEQLLGRKPGYKEVRVDTAPFWVYAITKKQDKITIVVEQTNGQQLAP